MKKILLAGGAGYIGTELCKRLQRLDYKVTVIDELWFGNNLNPKVELIQKDLLQVTHTELKGFDTVIFLGGVSNDPMAEFSPSENVIWRLYRSYKGRTGILYMENGSPNRRVVHCYLPSCHCVFKHGIYYQVKAHSIAMTTNCSLS